MATEETVELEGVFDRALTDVELQDLIEPDATPVPVTYSTQDFDVNGLVQRLRRGSMIVPSFGATDATTVTAGFQRGFVWSKAQMDRFVESLLLGYPVPGIFLVKQSPDNRMLILDGQQRLVTLRRFYEGVHAGKVFALDNVGDAFKGLTYESMEDALRYKLDDSFLQATIVTADGSPGVNEAVYQIFERLNAGGTQLTPHEIRVALYAGRLIDYMNDLNHDPAWRSLYGRPSVRIRDQELVLRIIALSLDSATYARPLKVFLNKFAERNRNLGPSVEEAGRLFKEACAVLLAGPGPRSLRRQRATAVNMAQAEAVLVGLMEALAAGRLTPDVSGAFDGLLLDEEFAVATSRATADRDAVTERLRIARETFMAP